MEATSFAIGVLKDSSSIPKLKKLTNSASDNVKIAAALALATLGDRSYLVHIEELAKKRNLFAIAALGQMDGFEDTLALLSKSPDLQIRINAAIALLQRRDPRCLPSLLEILIEDRRDLAFQPFPSIGRTLNVFKAVPLAELKAKDPSVDFTYSQAIREHLLREAIHLPEECFLLLASALFARGQNDLVPSTIALLENLQTAGAKAVLKEGAAKTGAPLIRDYCHLSLFRLKEEGIYEEYINRWVTQQRGADLIRLRPILPWKFRMDQSDHTLSPEETSKLLIDAFFSIASRRNERSISFLLDAIQLGNPKNRFVLMGLLMRATE